MSRRARTRTSILGFSLFLVVLPLVWVAHRAEASDTSAGSSPSSPGHSEHAPFTIPPDFKLKLIRAGLSPDVLAACGVPSNAILGVLQDAADQINGNLSALPAADAAYASARVTCDALQRKIQSGLASGEDVSSYQSAKTSLASATAARAAALDACFHAATADLNQTQKARLAQIRANRAATSTIGTFPLEFMVVERSESQWVALRGALANERIAVELPGTLSETAQASLTTWRADGTVSSAKSSLDSNLASVTGAWNQAAGTN